MEDKPYGNIFEHGLDKVYKHTINWRNKSYYYDGCKKCDYLDVCQTGCRMDAYAATGKMNGKDPLFKGLKYITKPYKLIKDDEVISKIKNGAKLFVPERIRWRDEKSFYLLNIRWANTIEVSVETANKLIKFQNNKTYFDINDFGLGKEKELATLIYKDALVSNEIKIEIKNKGVSVDPSKLPEYKL